jgi:hypothetical protein
MARRVKVGEERRNPINVRIRDVLRSRLEEAAELSSRSLSHEVEERLERSFDQKDIMLDRFRNYKNISILSSICFAWETIEILSGKEWNANSENLKMARDAAITVLQLVKAADGSTEEMDFSGDGSNLSRVYEGRVPKTVIDRDAIAALSAVIAVKLELGQDRTVDKELLYDAAARFFAGAERSDIEAFAAAQKNNEAQQGQGQQPAAEHSEKVSDVKDTKGRKGKTGAV